MSDLPSFAAEIVKVQTLADNGIRLTLDLRDEPESVIAAAKLMACKREGVSLKVTLEPEA